jgi:hypothetical protein
MMVNIPVMNMRNIEEFLRDLEIKVNNAISL